MQLTRAADYGIRAMVYLAGLPPDTRASIVELAKAADAPEAFLTKVLHRIAVAGFVVSYRGASGGFQLNVTPSDISILDVVEAIEGPIQLNLCTGTCNGAPGCGRQDWCSVHLVWQHAQAKLREILGGANLDALAKGSNARLLSLRAVDQPAF